MSSRPIPVYPAFLKYPVSLQPKASNERAFASACRNLSYLREIQMID